MRYLLGQTLLFLTRAQDFEYKGSCSTFGVTIYLGQENKHSFAMVDMAYPRGDLVAVTNVVLLIWMMTFKLLHPYQCYLLMK